MVVEEKNDGLRMMSRVTKTMTATMNDGGKKLGRKTTKFGRVAATKKGAKSKAEKQPKKSKGWTGPDSSQLGIMNFFQLKNGLAWTSGPKGIDPNDT